MATEIFVCLDLGNDTLKISYAYEAGREESYGKLMVDNLVNHVAIPAMAYYDEDERIWKYADELENTAGKPFRTVIKIKSILTMFIKPNDAEGAKENLDFYRNKEFFPKFRFPEKNVYGPNFQALVDKKLVFEAPGTTPAMVCEGFFKYVKNLVTKEIKELSEKTGLKFAPLRSIALVHPPKQGESYVEELTRLVWSTFGEKPRTVLTSTQALGLLAFHKKMFEEDDRVLIFDMGDETISVAKAWLNDNESVKAGILVDSREAHSEPVEVGGSDIDKNIAEYLETGIYHRETIGYPSSGEEGHIYESGLCANQYLMMKDIKKSKTAMPMVHTGMFKEGVPITIHREVLLQRLISEEEFLNCVGIGSEAGPAKKMMEYIFEELERSVNRDVTKIFIAGGMIETHGLLEYIRRELSVDYPHIKVYKFEEERNDTETNHIQFYEASAYASSLGGAIVAMKDYSIDNVLSYSYGTWLWTKNEVPPRKKLAIFADRGSLLKSEKNRFAIEASVRVQPESISTKALQCIDGDELFATIISQKEIGLQKYADKLTYYNNSIIIGDIGSEERRTAEEVVDLKVVGGGPGTEVRFYYRGSRVELYLRHGNPVKDIIFAEGFVVDQKGRALPFFENVQMKNNFTIMARNIETRAVYSNISARDIEFRLQMTDFIVTTQK